MDDFLRFHVSDTGIGIPEEEQENRIFDRFYQVEHTASPGTTRVPGWGSSISKAYSEFLGGKISGWNPVPAEDL
jgi:signal transduction histidine kinase